MALLNIKDTSEQQATPLHYAVFAKAENCARFLTRNRADVNLKDKLGNTPLHIAVLQKDVAMCHILVDGGADAGIKNKDNLNALDLC